MSDPQKSPLPQRIWNSVFRGPLAPRDDRERKLMVLESLILHLHPSTLPEKTLQFSLTWGLGGMAAVLLLVLIVTGVMLLSVYTPTPERAYNDILALQTNVWFGQLVRNLHHWSANAMLMVAFLHMLRVFFTGGFRAPRQFNWLLGLSLLLLTVAANFTGYLLPWDQLAFWAITIGAGLIEYIPFVGPWLQRVILGGPEVSAATLLNFYSLHIALIPIGILGIVSFHFWRVHKDGGVVVPRAPAEEIDPKPKRVTTIPHLVLRELVVALALLAGLLLWAMLVDAPLEALANPDHSPNPAKAPWYFMGVQELLLHFHPLVAALLIPLSGLGMLAILPYLDADLDSIGVWFRSVKGRWMGLTAVVVGLLVTPLLVIADETWLDFSGWLPSLPTLVSNGLVPLALVLLLLLGFYDGLKKSFAATRCETIQATFILLLTAFAVLTAIGIWFRGPGMALVWPG
ncbi:MAG: cytochrome bc complex cytochrome b subunit [Anaerolineae bacterium]|nr:cytochrome b N-terminal domain-containing protein [Anaerolineales bacterium]MCQ3972673.1 cytochrome bc complex cytochrome b subunit [Anaerolineae bacterium]